jgi:hypothetical protein
MADRAMDISEAARMIAVAPRSLSDKRFRQRIGLQARRIGKRRIVFLESDLLRLLERGREPLPGEARR